MIITSSDCYIHNFQRVCVCVCVCMHVFMHACYTVFLFSFSCFKQPVGCFRYIVSIMIFVFWWCYKPVVIDLVLVNCYSHVYTFVNICHGLEAEDGENDDACIDSSEGICHRHKNHITNTIILWWIVAAECNQRAKCQSKRVEDLCGCIQPDSRLQ